MCKPLLPLVLDELAHIFWEAEHLVTVHHHHGEHHVEEEIVKAGHEENNKQPPTTKTSEPVSAHIIIETLYDISLPQIHSQQFAEVSCNVSTISLDKNDPPPKQC